MSDDPAMVSVRRLGTVLGGGTPTSDETNWNGDIPFVTPPDLRGLDGALVGETARSLSSAGLGGSTLAPVGAVVISTRAPVGYVGRLRQASAFNQGCRALVPSDRAEARYLAYALVAARDEMDVRAQGTTFMELSGSQFASIAIPTRALDEQRAIADYLDEQTTKIDALIAKQNEMIGLLEERLDAVISQAVEIGSKTTRMSRCLAGLKDGTHGTHARHDTGVVLLSAKNIKDGTVFMGDGESMISADEAAEITRTGFPRTGDVLLAIIGASIGNTAIYDLPESLPFQRSVAMLRPSRDTDPRFIEYQLRTRRLQSAMLLAANSSAQPGLYLGAVADLPMYLPSFDTQRSIAEALDRETAQSDALIAKTRDHIALAQERRSALITAAVTGQVDVRTATREVVA